MTNGRAKDSFGAPFYSYIQEKRWEKMAGRQLNNDSHSSAQDWGNMCEQIAFEKMGLEYKIVSKTRYKHDTLPWSGCPDLLTEDTVGDIKCPWTLNAFFKIYDRGDKSLKEVVPEYYWQLVSNALLTGRNKCELVIFMPQQKSIEYIQDYSQEKGYYFYKKVLSELPWTVDLPEITKIQFELDDNDAAHLEDRIRAATEILNK